MSQEMFQISVFRFDSETSKDARFENFQVAVPPNLTVLQALMKIQDEVDGSLAVRFSCRGAVCGSCAMVINDRLTLACRTQLGQFPLRNITVEPLPNLDIIKDLVVDMEPFWRAYEKVEPWLHAQAELPEKENPVTEKDRMRIDQYVNCILCACCYGACPVIGRKPEYIGPAAHAKLYRFLEDVRDTRNDDLPEGLDSENGVWGCDTVFRCIEHCPKEVRPYDGIGGLRRRLIAERLFRRSRRRR